MIPFPGESVLVSDAYDDTDGTLPTDIVYRAGSRYLSPGHEWRMFVYSADMDYAEGPLDATVQWAVEVLGGEVTVEAREGLDPTYLDTGMVLPVDLGTHTFTGPGTFLIDSTFTADQVADLDGSVSAAFQLGLTAITGTAEVQQIKLRVWPVGGARGAFVRQSGFDTDPEMAPVFSANDTSRNASVSVPGAEASWTAAHDALSSISGPYTFTALFTSGPSAHYEGVAQYRVSQSNIGDGNVLTTLGVESQLALIIGADWAAQHPVGPLAPAGYIRPPTEVRDENVRVLFPQIGTGATGWVDAMATLTMTGIGVEGVPAVTVLAQSAPPPTPERVPMSDLWLVDTEMRDDGVDQVVPMAGETISTAVGLPTGGRFILLYVSHEAANGIPPWPGVTPGGPSDPAVESGIDTTVSFGQGDPAGLFYPIKTYARMPGYKVWYPDAVPETPPGQPHQIFQRHDGLGAGTAFVYQPDTRQASTLVFGTF